MWLLPAPQPKTGVERMTGARIFKVDPARIDAVTFRLGDASVELRRVDGAWTIDGAAATAGEAAAIDDLVTLLVRLRAVDSFRSENPAQFAFDPPQAVITVSSAGHETRLDLGGFNSTGTTVYGQRDGDPRVFQLGTQVLSGLRAVLYQRALARDRPPGTS